MRYITVKTYDELSTKAAALICAQVNVKPNSVLGLATGSSPLGTYAKIIEKCANGEVDFSEVSSINLDEYIGLDGSHDQSYRYFMNTNLFSKINIDLAKTNVPNGCATDLEAECKELREYIEELDEDLGAVEEDLYLSDDEDENDDDFDYDEDDIDDGFYSMECPSCGEKVCFDESVDPTDLACPACGEKLLEDAE